MVITRQPTFVASTPKVRARSIAARSCSRSSAEPGVRVRVRVRVRVGVGLRIRARVRVRVRVKVRPSRWRDLMDCVRRALKPDPSSASSC